MIVHHRHMKAAGLRYCNPGARVWFKHHGLDWNQFVNEGINADVLIATGDAMALAVVEEAKKEWAEKAAVKR
jgi:hypothetical protein